MDPENGTLKDCFPAFRVQVSFQRDIYIYICIIFVGSKTTTVYISSLKAALPKNIATKTHVHQAPSCFGLGLGATGRSIPVSDRAQARSSEFDGRST